MQKKKLDHIQNAKTSKLRAEKTLSLFEDMFAPIQHDVNSCTEARRYIHEVQRNLSIITQNFMFAQLAREGSLDFEFAAPLSYAEVLRVYGTLEKVNEFFRRMEEVYRGNNVTT